MFIVDEQKKIISTFKKLFIFLDFSRSPTFKDSLKGFLKACVIAGGIPELLSMSLTRENELRFKPIKGNSTYFKSY